MKYIAAYLLLTTGGNASPSAEDIKTVISSVGIEPEEDRISALLAELEGKTIADLIAEGSEKLASVPTGGAAAPAAAGGAAAAAEEEEVAAPAEEEKEESDDDMGFGLFD
ncbi:60s acidic ribosomal protein-domain-containing protein [Myxozyma melibiosi]|uniref:60s acidic ribosomal protein-domain-containing protein n=1 Tax=Myxozyma melibiosi TaxID=54550 RepID=A0ABR1F4D1_9ASCO